MGTYSSFEKLPIDGGKLPSKLFIGRLMLLWSSTCKTTHNNQVISYSGRCCETHMTLSPSSSHLRPYHVWPGKQGSVGPNQPPLFTHCEPAVALYRSMRASSSSVGIDAATGRMIRLTTIKDRMTADCSIKCEATNLITRRFTEL